MIYEFTLRLPLVELNGSLLQTNGYSAKFFVILLPYYSTSRLNNRNPCYLTDFLFSFRIPRFSPRPYPMRLTHIKLSGFGESMQDVIFNGAATRRPAPRASVELVFDNSDHSLQGAWGQYAEVSIKRQLTRQGESTYFINNQTVRCRV